MTRAEALMLANRWLREQEKAGALAPGTLELRNQKGVADGEGWAFNLRGGGLPVWVQPKGPTAATVQRQGLPPVQYSRAGSGS